MLSKAEIEKVNKILSCDNCPTSYACEGCEIMWTDKQLLKKYIAQLEEENKALKKGITSLMASRKKWRYRYYKEKRKSNKQSKMIDEMAKELDKLKDILDKDCFIPREYSDIDDCVRKISCIDCLKQYFEKKVEEK